MNSGSRPAGADFPGVKLIEFVDLHFSGAQCGGYVVENVLGRHKSLANRVRIRGERVAGGVQLRLEFLKDFGPARIHESRRIALRPEISTQGSPSRFGTRESLQSPTYVTKATYPSQY